MTRASRSCASSSPRGRMKEESEDIERRRRRIREGRDTDKTRRTPPSRGGVEPGRDDGATLGVQDDVAREERRGHAPPRRRRRWSRDDGGHVRRRAGRDDPRTGQRGPTTQVSERARRRANGRGSVVVGRLDHAQLLLLHAQPRRQAGIGRRGRVARARMMILGGVMMRRLMIRRVVVEELRRRRRRDRRGVSARRARHELLLRVLLVVRPRRVGRSARRRGGASDATTSRRGLRGRPPGLRRRRLGRLVLHAAAVVADGRRRRHARQARHAFERDADFEETDGSVALARVDAARRRLREHRVASRRPHAPAVDLDRGVDEDLADEDAKVERLPLVVREHVPHVVVAPRSELRRRKVEKGHVLRAVGDRQEAARPDIHRDLVFADAFGAFGVRQLDPELEEALLLATLKRHERVVLVGATVVQHFAARRHARRHSMIFATDRTTDRSIDRSEVNGSTSATLRATERLAAILASFVRVGTARLLGGCRERPVVVRDDDAPGCGGRRRLARSPGDRDRSSSRVKK
mmetsp:Transcript_6909/g.28824  ORF Transcript_6909/g.28824 Transcript_6909/m.28824 type:complete len:523 (+) Transcript_6909:1112-2680(+)